MQKVSFSTQSGGTLPVVVLKFIPLLVFFAVFVSVFLVLMLVFILVSVYNKKVKGRDLVTKHSNHSGKLHKRLLTLCVFMKAAP